MIWESAPYKSEVGRIGEQFAKWECRKRLNSRDFVRIEMAAFTSAYLVRKLMEARKLSDRVRDSQVQVTETRNIKPVTLLNWHRIDELYDFSTSQARKLPLRFFCNQLIHSYVFTVAIAESGGLSSLMFSSDSERNRRLYTVRVSALSRALKLVGRDRPRRGEWRFNDKTGDFEARLR